MANIVTKLIQRFTNVLPENAQRDTKEDTGLTIKTSPVLWDYEMFILEWERRSLLRDLELMRKRDTRIDRANYVFANAATRGGITINVEKAPTVRLKKAAQDVLDKLMKECKVNANLRSWGQTCVGLGDLFLNPIPTMNSDGRTARITRIKSLPAITMERRDDMTDNFPDIKQAFAQVDVISRLEIQTFPLWSINHIRWNYESGERYGRSQYHSGRAAWNKLHKMEEDLVVRRRTRAVQRRVHIIGNKDNPGGPGEVSKYKADNKLDNPKNSQVTTDYFINGLGDVKNLEGDAHLDHINDVNYLLENVMIGTGVPLHILGFGRNVNRDIVDDQKKTFKEDVQGLQDLLEHGDPGTFSGLRAIFNMALALAGINPEDVSYSVQWTQLDDLNLERLMDIVIKGRSAQPSPMMSRRKGLQILARHLDFDEDGVENEIKELDAERQADLEAEQAAAANINPMKPTTTPTDRPTSSSPGKAMTDSSIKPSNPLRSEDMAKLEKSTADDVRRSFAKVARLTTEAEFVKSVAHFAGLAIGKEKVGNTHSTGAQLDAKDEKHTDPGIKIYEAARIAPELLRIYVLRRFDETWQEEEETLTNNLFSRYLEAAGMAADTLHDDIKASVEFEHVSKEVRDYLQSEAGKRIKGIADTTRKQIADALDKSYSNSERLSGYLERLADVIEAPEWRIEMIARTEMAFAFNESNLKYQTLAGYTKFRWLAVMDNRTCPRCAERNDKVYSISEITNPPLHPRCRCILLPES